MLQPTLRDEVWMRQSMNTRKGYKVLPASSDLHKSHGKTSAIPVQCSQANWELVTLLVCNMPVGDEECK